MKGAVKSSRGRREADESCRVLARSVIMIEAAVGCISADRSSASCTVLWLNPVLPHIARVLRVVPRASESFCQRRPLGIRSDLQGSSAYGSGPSGRRFKSSRPDQSSQRLARRRCTRSFSTPHYLTKNATPAAEPSWIEVTHFWHMGLVPWPLFVVGQPRERIQLRRIFAETGDGLLSRQVLRIPWAPEAVRVEIKPSLNSSPVHLFGGTVPPPSSSKGGAHHGTCCTDREV
jgi:hypothetical protein